MAKRFGPKDPSTRHTIDYRKSARGVEAPARHDIAPSARRVVGQGPVDETVGQGHGPTLSDSARDEASTSTAVIEHVSGNTYLLRNPAGEFVCQGPLDFLERVAARNGWGVPCR
jgi:hypothetical protein